MGAHKDHGPPALGGPLGLSLVCLKDKTALHTTISAWMTHVQSTMLAEPPQCARLGLSVLVCKSISIRLGVYVLE